MKSPRLTSMSLDELRKHAEKVMVELERRYKKERARIVKELEKLGVVDAVANSWRKRPRRKAAIKYRGPKGEKWSGRGMTPLWMRAYLKKGKKKEQFLVK